MPYGYDAEDILRKLESGHGVIVWSDRQRGKSTALLTLAMKLHRGDCVVVCGTYHIMEANRLLWRRLFGDATPPRFTAEVPRGVPPSRVLIDQIRFLPPEVEDERQFFAAVD